ncbi:MAG: VTT domain-containing protein [Gemmatimonadota bacterium]|nr:VTT domain-containing protein [Gemmatimonadota bacterium]
MHALLEFLHRLRNLPELIRWGGYVALAAIVFSETGLLVGFFLPGDSLLVTAGLLASQPDVGLNVYALGGLLWIAAICGNSLGYTIGRATGPRIFRRESSLLFNRKHLLRAHDFYERHGRKTIVLAQFMPIIRTFAPVVAGVAAMPYRDFILFNVFGALVWIWGMLFTGYLLGRHVPGVAAHIEPVILIVIFLSILPGIIGWIRERRRVTGTAGTA